ncbi:MAG: cysE 1 [Actinomycetia bacterium]|nr:cysE 1 [Actinomycetes bacterium]
MAGANNATSSQPSEVIGLVALWREDLVRHRGRWSTPGFQALAVQRFGAWARERGGVQGKLVRRIHKALFVFVRNFYGIEIHAETRIGRRLLIGHQHGIVIHPAATIGDDCVLRHNVTLGDGARYWTDEAPHLGNHVRVGPGAVILGDVHVGDDAQIGPNALVTTDVPEGAVVFEKPTRILQLTKKTAPAE